MASTYWGNSAPIASWALGYMFRLPTDYFMLERFHTLDVQKMLINNYFFNKIMAEHIYGGLWSPNKNVN